MSERERLIKLFLDCRYGIDDTPIFDSEESVKLADYLLENGVIVPPVKVGDTVYQTDNAGDIYKSKVTQIVYSTKDVAFDERAIGKYIFLTREEAEKALKERDKNDNIHSTSVCRKMRTSYNNG